MSDKKQAPKELTNDILIADIMLRVTAIEKILIDKGILTQEELNTTTEEIAKRVAKVVLEKAGAKKTIDELVADLGEINKKGEMKN